MKTIGFRISDELFKEIKLKAVKQEVTVKDYITELIKKDLQKEKE